MSLYHVMRPTLLEEVVGQEAAVGLLKTKLTNKDLPHVLLFVGPTGTGKTTLARITAELLGCTEGNLIETNCADDRGIDLVRNIDEVAGLAPMGGISRVWILDEVVQLPKTTQQAFLKVLEDPPRRAYFLLCSSNTRGLLPTFLGRCMVINLAPLSKPHLKQIINQALQHEERQLDNVVMMEIVNQAKGSARNALQHLEAALTAKTVDDQMRLVNLSVVAEEEKGEFLGRVLFASGFNWDDVAKTIKDMKDTEVEGVRRQVLAYAMAVLLGRGDGKRANSVIVAFGDAFVDSGKAGLASACWQVLKGGR